MQIDILGTEYTFLTKTKYEDVSLEIMDGYCKPYEKLIIVEKNEDVEFRNRVTRHEIIHAYLFESGLQELTNNEILVDWLAIQFPKLSKTFNELERL